MLDQLNPIVLYDTFAVLVKIVLGSAFTIVDVTGNVVKLEIIGGELEYVKSVCSRGIIIISGFVIEFAIKGFIILKVVFEVEVRLKLEMFEDEI